jgi:hypothetical protein
VEPKSDEALFSDWTPATSRQSPLRQPPDGCQPRFTLPVPRPTSPVFTTSLNIGAQSSPCCIHVIVRSQSRWRPGQFYQSYAVASNFRTQLEFFSNVCHVLAKSSYLFRDAPLYRLLHQFRYGRYKLRLCCRLLGTLIPVLVYSSVCIVLFLVLRNRIPRVYSPRTFLSSLHE